MSDEQNDVCVKLIRCVLFVGAIS